MTFDDFDIQIQCDEVLNYNDRLDDLSYVYEEDM